MKNQNLNQIFFPGISLFLLCFFLLNQASGEEKKFFVAATTTMVTDMAQQVAGDRCEVSGLMGPGVDPHLYKPTASDIQTLRNADVILYSGLLLEGRMGDLFAQMARMGKKVYAVTDSVKKEDLLELTTIVGHYDPHVWGDAALWSQCIEVIVEALSTADPDGELLYRQRGRFYKEELLELDKWAKARAAELPEEDRILITSHDAFSYFGRAYGFQVVGVQGISTVTEAGLADVAKTVEFILKNRIKAIFVESSVSPATIRRISRDAQVKVGGELFSDATGTSGEIETAFGGAYDKGTYVGMLKHNVNTVVGALK